MDKTGVRKIAAVVFGGALAVLAMAVMGHFFPAQPCTPEMHCEDLSGGVVDLFSGPWAVKIAAVVATISGIVWGFAFEASKVTGALMLAVLLAIPRPAHAIFGVGDIVFDPTIFANEVQQLAQDVQEVKALQSQLQYVIQNTTGGLGGIFTSPNQLLGQMSNIISDNEGVAYSLSNVTQEFQRLYPGNQIIGGAQAPGVNFQQTLNTLMGAIATLQAHQQNFANEDTTLMTLDVRNMAVVGNLQAEQVGNDINLHLAREMQLAQQMQMAAINAQNVATAQHMQDEIDTRNQQTVVGNMRVPGDMADPANNVAPPPLPGQ